MSGRKSRSKGHCFERNLASWFRKWFPKAATSRAESKSRDAEGVDLIRTGCFLVQAKASERLGSVHKILAEMPDEPGCHRVVMHKRNHQGVVVSMYMEDFEELLDIARGHGII